MDILTYASTFTTWSTGMIRAARMAAAFDGMLTAAYVCPSPPLDALSPYGGMQVAAAMIESIRELEARADAARSGFEAQALSYGVRRSTWQVAEGHVPEVLRHLGNWHDLLVLERGDAMWATPAALGNILLTAGLPALVLPSDSTDRLTLNCIALAWNGAPEGLRAIHAARPLLARAKRLVVLHGQRRNPFSEIGWRPEFALDAYLARHGYHAETRALNTDDDGAGTALLDAAKAVGADLLVMGAYGHPRLSEWVFGGATRHILHHATLPVLFRH